MSNGVYLYSDTPQPNQISHNYVLFRHHNGKVIGAFYSPQSEFSCFTGKVQGTRLDIEAMVNGEPRLVDADTSLSGLYSIAMLSDSDQRILAMCQRSEIARSIR